MTNQDYVATAGGGRAGGFVDYNNDGFLDIYNYTGLNSVLQKNGGNSNHWIGFTPVGTGHNLNAVGARFTVYTQGNSFEQYPLDQGRRQCPGSRRDARPLRHRHQHVHRQRRACCGRMATTATYTGLAVDKILDSEAGFGGSGHGDTDLPGEQCGRCQLQRIR